MTNQRTMLTLNFDQNEWSVIRLNFSTMKYCRERAAQPDDKFEMPTSNRITIGGAVSYNGAVFGQEVGPNVYD